MTPAPPPSQNSSVRTMRTDLDAARHSAGLPILDLWIRYVEIGGTLSADEIAEALNGGALEALEHDLIARAINERRLELGLSAAAAYELTTPTPRSAGTARVHAPTRTMLPTVGVIIPTLNESRNIPHVLKHLPPEVDEVVIVDGHSTDDTVVVAKTWRPDAKIVMQDKTGKGNALIAGARAITSDIAVMIDADGSTDPDEIPRFVQALVDGADVAKGSRFVAEGGTTDMTLIRRLGNLFFTWLVNLVWGVRYTDLCYGYNAAWTRCLPILLGECRGFEIETLMNIRAASSGLKTVEVASFEQPRLHGDSNLHAFRDGMRVLRTILAEALRPR